MYMASNMNSIMYTTGMRTMNTLMSIPCTVAQHNNINVTSMLRSNKKMYIMYDRDGDRKRNRNITIMINGGVCNTISRTGKLNNSSTVASAHM